ncbi:MAG: BglII/BstYI family type II restriction endonuclease [Planctomycetota bacterium]|jgi:hypothetical protein
MKIGATHSHLGGLEWLKVHEPDTLNEIESVLAGVPLCDDADRLNHLLAAGLRDQGWRHCADQADEPLRKDTQSGAANDFIKSRIAVDVHLGEHGPPARDLFARHLAFYVGDAIDVGVEILPMKEMQEQMSSGPGYYEGALYDLARQGRGVPSVPLVLMGILPD